MINKIFPLFASFLIGLTFGMNMKIAYEASTFKPYAWESAPDIVNCYGKDFSELQMKRAMQYWSLRGYKTGKYIHSPAKDICDEEWIPGNIILRKSIGLPTNTIASTRRYSVLVTMKGAVIRYRPGSYNLDLINEHELGHALGFTHLEIEKHIMHPDFDKMGRDFWIPAN